MLDVNGIVRDWIGLGPEFQGLDELDPALVYLMGCRKFDQFCCTWRSLTDYRQFCPFCPTELARRERKPLSSTNNWMLLENEFPRNDAEHMLLLVPTRHAIAGSSLMDSDWTDIGVLFAAYLKSHVYPSGAFVMRHGDPRDHAGTIEHLHINLIRPTREGGLSVPLAKTVAEHQADYARLFEFVEKLDQRGGMEWLFSDEGIGETQPIKG